MDQNAFRNYIAGKRRLAGKCLFVLMRALSVIYCAVVTFRNFLYNKGVLKSHQADVPVVSIGNITAGGTGKTPLVIWVCKWLQKNGRSCAVLTRGYKAHKGKFTDEPAIIAKSCPDTKIVIDADRVSGAHEAVTEFNVQTLVMDDGFQHRRLRRNIDIVVIDATCAFGYDRVLPAGLLREPVRNIRRADLIVITRSDQVSSEVLKGIKKRLHGVAGDIAIARTVNSYPYAQKIGGCRLSFGELKSRKIFAFCGIGNPGAFVNHLTTLGFELVGQKIFNDHHEYTQDDLEDIYEEAKYCQADLVLTTLKDWVKAALLMKPFERDQDMEFAYLSLELNFVEGLDKIENLLRKVAQPSRSNQNIQHGS